MRLSQANGNEGMSTNTETYNIMIAGFCEIGMVDSANETFHEMRRMGVPWNFVTFVTLIHGFCSCGRTKDGFMIFELMLEGESNGYYGRIGPYNSILYGLYRDSYVDRAHEFLNYMRSVFPRTVDKSSTILQLCEQGDVAEAKQVLDGMREGGSFPSALIYASLIQGLCNKGCTKEALKLLNEMIRIGYFPVASTFNAILDGLCRLGKIGVALKLLEELTVRDYLPDSESYVLVINAMCNREDQFQQVPMVLIQMVERGVVPDYCTWNAVIHATWKCKIDLLQEHALVLLHGLADGG